MLIEDKLLIEMVGNRQHTQKKKKKSQLDELMLNLLRLYDLQCGSKKAP